MSDVMANMAKVVKVFEENFSQGLELGASVSVWWQGQEVWNHGQGWADRARTRAWNEQTLVPVYSATKAAAAAALLTALQSKGLNERTAVREVWPHFPVEGATFAQMMSHQCVLAALDRKVSVWDFAAVIEAVEAQRPAWLPGEGVGYHPRTLGFLYDHCVRRLTGVSLGEWWWTTIAQPAGWEFWIGLPEAQHHRVAELMPGRAQQGDAESGFYKEFMSEGTMTRRAFFSPTGLHAVQEMNQPQAWSAGFPAMGGIGTARALAQFYQACMGYGEGVFDESVRHALQERQVQGDDLVLLQKAAFTCGCQMDPCDEFGKKSRQLYGPGFRAFGHPGAGGSHAFADPESGLSFAYVMNQMSLSVMPGPRSQRMVAALFGESFK
jgi:CubicO group peptidase (beta-lactamase class C family)